MKKVLSVVLSAAMIICMVPAMAFAAPVKAAGFTDAASISNQDAVTVLVELGVINGYPDGSFKPANAVTREEAIKMIDEVYEGGNFDAVAKNYSTNKNPFNDVAADRWSANYIAYGVAKNVIQGHGDGTFTPESTVTAAQLAKMAEVALGITPNDVNKNWPENAVAFAKKYGLFDGLGNISPDKELNRDETAQLIFNMLNNKMQNKTIVEGNSVESYAPLSSGIKAIDYYFPKNGFKTGLEQTDEYGRPAKVNTVNGNIFGKVVETPIVSVTDGSSIAKKLAAAGYASKGNEFVNIVVNGTLVEEWDFNKNDIGYHEVTYLNGTLSKGNKDSVSYCTEMTLDEAIKDLNAINGKGVVIDVYDIDRDGLFDYVVVEDTYYATVTSVNAKKGTATLELSVATDEKTDSVLVREGSTAKITVKTSAFDALANVAVGDAFLVDPAVNADYTADGVENIKLVTNDAVAITPASATLVGTVSRIAAGNVLTVNGTTNAIAKNITFHDQFGNFVDFPVINKGVNFAWDRLDENKTVYEFTFDEYGYVINITEAKATYDYVYIEEGSDTAVIGRTVGAVGVFTDGSVKDIRVAKVRTFDADGTKLTGDYTTFVSGTDLDNGKQTPDADTQNEKGVTTGDDMPIIPQGLYTYTVDSNGNYALTAVTATGNFKFNSLEAYALDMSNSITLNVGKGNNVNLSADANTIYLIHKGDKYEVVKGYNNVKSIGAATGYVIDRTGAAGAVVRSLPDGVAEVVVVEPTADSTVKTQVGLVALLSATPKHDNAAKKTVTYAGLLDGKEIDIEIPEGTAVTADQVNKVAIFNYTTVDDKTIYINDKFNGKDSFVDSVASIDITKAEIKSNRLELTTADGSVLTYSLKDPATLVEFINGDDQGTPFVTIDEAASVQLIFNGKTADSGESVKSADKVKEIGNLPAATTANDLVVGVYVTTAK